MGAAACAHDAGAVDGSQDMLQMHEARLQERMAQQGGSPMLLLDLAFIELARGNGEQALSRATHAMVRADAEVRTHATICCALACSQLQRHDSVIAYLSRIAPHPALPPQIRILLGDAYLESGKWLNAVECYDLVLSRWPRRFDVHRRKLRALWRQAIAHILS